MNPLVESTGQKFVIIAAVPNLKAEGGLAYLVNDPGYEVVYVATVEALHEQIAQLKMDLVLVELGLAGLDPLDLVIRVRSRDPNVPVMVLCSRSESKLIEEGIWNAGIDDGICLPVSAVEVRHRVARSLRLRQLGTLYERLKQENRSLWELSVTDGLTKLINRRYFDEIAELEFARARRFGSELGCLLLDIDHFKKINDTHGHLAGDFVLQKLASTLHANLRAIDIAARYGGEEFVLLLPETGVEGLKFVAEKLRSAVENQNFSDPAHPEMTFPERVTVSIGAALYPHSKPQNAKTLIAAADEALYEAKNSGRNRVVLK